MRSMKRFCPYVTRYGMAHIIAHLDAAAFLKEPSFLMGAVVSTRVRQRLSDKNVRGWSDGSMALAESGESEVTVPM